MQLCDIGVMGLAVMGSNLALNMEEKGFCVAAYDRDASLTHDFARTHAQGKRFCLCDTPQAFIAALRRPRAVFLMIRAGAPVDETMDVLLPLLQEGDVLIDGGNSLYTDTARRAQRAKEAGVLYLGVGVSGGAQGARHGASLMPGGAYEGWLRVKDILTAIAAKADDGTPCCDYIAGDGAGHFVKMVHNGIEYGDMQLICESYFLLKELAHLDAPALRDVFLSWNRGVLQSYLIEITADILMQKDEETGGPLLEQILDCAGQKGTGMWTSRTSLEMGVCAPTIAEAVYARCMSAQRQTRLRAEQTLQGPERSLPNDAQAFARDVEQALYASKICSYAQGFALLQNASERYGWNLDLAMIARLWRGGCIIRAQFLDRIAEAYEKNAALCNLMLDSYFARALEQAQSAWRRVAASAALNGVPAPCFMSALSYYDALRTGRSSANLLQAQRDLFGAHTYQRIDREGVFHTEWTRSGGERA